MFLIPYEKFENVTELTKDEVLESIMKSDYFVKCIFFQYHDKEINGEAEKSDRFKMRPRIKRRNSFVPLIICEMKQNKDNKLHINYTIRPFKYVIVFALAWLAPLFVLSVKSIVESINSEGISSLDLAPIAVFIIILTVFISVFKYRIPRIKRLLLEMIESDSIDKNSIY